MSGLFASLKKAFSGLAGMGQNNGKLVNRSFDTRISIRNGVGGTEDTINEMARLAFMGSRDQIVRILTERAIRGVQGRDHRAVATRLFYWLQDRGSGEKSGVKFVNDAFRTEQVRAPWWTLIIGGAGDCNSAFSTTLAAMLMSVGIPAFFRTVKADPQRPNSFSHVYCVASIDGEDLALDASVPFSSPGSEPAVIYGQRDWPINYKEEDDFGVFKGGGAA
jgi:hypothetical protein